MKPSIDRKALVTRHNPVIHALDPLSPLSVGNSEIAYTVDLTGMQSFPNDYTFPLGTQSQWGWHSSGNPDKHQLEELRLKEYETYGRKVGYETDPEDQEEVFHWLRQNPHRLQLGRVGLAIRTEDGKRIAIADVQDAKQTLDMWSGTITSRFRVEGMPVEVITCCHPHSDQIGIRIDSPLLAQGRLSIEIAFPDPEPVSRNWGKCMAVEWGHDETHETKVADVSSGKAVFERTMDSDGYRMDAEWSGSAELSRDAKHSFTLTPSALTETFSFTFGFVRTGGEIELLPADAIQVESSFHWEAFWNDGGVIELAESQDERALELERRIVLSQFLTAIHCAGSLPPQETGLLYNSWFGKFHLEMHWWHAAHFAQWGRIGLLKKSLDWYRRILPVAEKLARSQGYEGARWPKMVGPEGRQSPSPIGALLIWQQPHPIDLAELCYQAEPTLETLDWLKDVVMESARFMASFAVWDADRKAYVLGPPVIPAQENHRGEDSINPTFELEYWRHGLEIALKWRERLGMPTEALWERVRDGLAPLPVGEEGVYMAHERCPDTYTKMNIDHPSMLGALGILPGKAVDHDVMRATLNKVVTEWKWDTSWGWDFPMSAMTAARLGDGNRAVDLLLMDATKNTYLLNGHNYQRDNLLAYLPGNGGLLAAVALMACGWQDGPDTHAPGFPSDGTWTVRWEGLRQRL
ncbi:glycoside hydrolase family 65 [Paenibacillus sp. UNC451MF]|uniref:glycoside hydrolase family 65 n=1 Tax=Paenibacillus sp. UNC451MF TaxID=1449063 RepID=UPI00056878CC|nr:glycoside hydrolase family 65 [Paenibacillus sp. UNC451MF]